MIPRREVRHEFELKDEMKPTAPSGFKLTPTKRALLEALLQRDGVNRKRLERIPRRKDCAVIPASYAQQGLWLIDQLGEGSSLYNIPLGKRIEGPLNMQAFAQSLDEVVRRHEALRTTFTVIDGEPMQVISAPQLVGLPLIDLRHIDADRREAELQRVATAEAEQPFDLSRGPLLRVGLVRMGEEDHILLLTMHHIIADGWSCGVLFGELSELYNAFSQRQASPLPELELQYADFAIWQREWLRVEALDEQLGYWCQQLADASPRLELTIERAVPVNQNKAAAIATFSVTQEITEQLKARSRIEGVTLFMTLLAAFQILLARYSGQDDIVVGTPSGGREREEIQPLIGLFVNTLLLRTNLEGNPTLGEFLAVVKEVVLAAHAHQDLPFKRLVEELRPDRSFSDQPLCQITLQLQQSPRESLMFHGLQCTAWHRGLAIAAKFDLSVSLVESAGCLSGAIEYNSDLFERSSIQRLTGHYINLLESIRLEGPKSAGAQSH